MKIEALYRIIVVGLLGGILSVQIAILYRTSQTLPVEVQNSSLDVNVGNSSLDVDIGNPEPDVHVINPSLDVDVDQPVQVQVVQ